MVTQVRDQTESAIKPIIGHISFGIYHFSILSIEGLTAAIQLATAQQLSPPRRWQADPTGSHSSEVP